MPSAGRDPAPGAAPPRDGPHARPRVVIAAPLHNGGPHVEAALRSLLAQTYADFRLILVDDASTDAHGGDRRGDRAPRTRASSCTSIRERLGMLENTRRAWRAGAASVTRTRSSGRSAPTTTSGSPRWLETLVALLDADPAAVLAYPLTRRIDGDGRPIADRPRPWRCDTGGLADPRARVRAAYRCMVAGDMIYGLFRASRARRGRAPTAPCSCPTGCC